MFAVLAVCCAIVAARARGQTLRVGTTFNQHGDTKPSENYTNYYADLLNLLKGDEKRIPSEWRTQFALLRSSKVPTPREAERLAEVANRRAGGPGLSGVQQTVGLVRSGVTLQGHVSVGDLLWVVRTTELGGVSQENWIVARTGDSFFMLPTVIQPERIGPTPTREFMNAEGADAEIKSQDDALPDAEYGRYLPPEAPMFSGDELHALINRDTLLTYSRKSLLWELSHMVVRTPRAAVGIAEEEFTKVNGRDTGSRARLVGLIHVGGNVPGFAWMGDLIWVVRFIRSPEYVVQEVWVSSTTGRVRIIYPLEHLPPGIGHATGTGVDGTERSQELRTTFPGILRLPERSPADAPRAPRNPSPKAVHPKSEPGGTKSELESKPAPS